MPQYRLQTLLEIRARAKEAAEQAFAIAMQELAAERQRLKEMEEDLERRKAERQQKVMAYLADVMKKGVGAGGLNMMNRFEERLKDEEAQCALEIERQKEAVKAAEDNVEAKRHEMAEAAKELKAIEKHKESWQAQVRKEREAREELTQEEIGNALHLMRSRR
ncbi:MAG: YscO family type III secretion system apparatus protein [Myxococcaceae bacterium]|nr:YscO family type III secretion system apparatus protein [Myxococcaceae bacterium]